ncbi:MMPL family transporter [Sodalis sp. RH22]|uniref:MMPL family transporter n=1 Tax=unclassified Sodalis (in: enterobacteria) TaxID=2636512 RepID=UPI0039B4751D
MTSSSALSSESFSKFYLRAAAAWLLICLGLLLALALLLPRSQINSSVLALLPRQAMGPLPPAVYDGFMQRLDRQLVWMVSPADGQGLAPVQWWAQQVAALPGMGAVKGPMTEQQQQQWGRFYFQHRNAMIDDQTRARLQQGGGAQADWIAGQLYSAFAGVGGQELQHDPLLLVRGSQLALQQSAGRLTLDQGWLMSRDPQGAAWYLIHAELAASSYDMQSSHQVALRLAQLRQQLETRWPGARLLSRGTLFYSDYASQQARHDISTLGLATVIGVLLLIGLVFRSPLPLLCCALSVAVGALAGTVACLLLFGELHVMTLMMSISIVGISADYTLYYLTERLVHGRQNTPMASLRKVLPALSAALATTVAAYLIMVLAPFPGLRQLAVFAAAGLSAACLTVICWYPLLTRRLPVRPTPALPLIRAWLSAWRHRKVLRVGLPLALAVFTLAGLLQLRIDDDIAQLQALPQQIHQQEEDIARLSGQEQDQKWLVVTGASAEQTLQRMEQLAPALAQAQSRGILAGYRMPPLSSQRRQREDLALLTRAAPAAVERLGQIGVGAAAPDLSPMPVSPTDWLASVVSEGWRLLWLSLADGQSAVLIPVSGVTDSAALRHLAQSQPGVSWVDRKADFDAMFAAYRHKLGWLLLASIGVIAASFIARQGWRQGLLSLIPTLLSLGAGLSVLALSGHTLNLFSMLALVLVLGIGINYQLFFANPRGTPSTSMLAVTLAVMTTSLTLGMLVFSHTQAIASFGIVLCSGIFTAFLLSPLALPPGRGDY